MSGVWLASFVVGVLLGRAVGGFVLAAGVAGLGGWAIGRRSRRAAAAGAGLLWGIVHAAPPLDVPLPAAVIAAANSGMTGAERGAIIVCAPAAQPAASRCFETYGPSRVGAIGGARAVSSAPGLFARVHSVFVERYAGAGPPPTGFAGAVTALRRRFDANLARHPRLLRAWLRGLVLGDRRAVPPRLLAAFRRVGLYHLLAVSGLHVTLAATLLAGALRLPLLVLYAARLLSPVAWRRLAPATRVVGALIALLYLGVTGSPIAAQRSALVFVLWQLAPVFVGVPPAPARLSCAAAAQAAFFPVGFVSEPVLMSWSAYLLLTARAGAVARQLCLALVVAAAFGQVSCLSVPANLVLVPLFGVLLGTALLLGLFPGLPGAPLLLDFHRNFLAIVQALGDLVDRFPWLAPRPEDLPLSLRLAAVLGAALVLLNTCRALTISPYVDD